MFISYIQFTDTLIAIFLTLGYFTYFKIELFMYSKFRTIITNTMQTIFFGIPLIYKVPFTER